MSSVTFSTAVGGDGSTVTDDNNVTTGLREGGWKTRFVPCFTQQVAVANYVVTQANAASASATAAGSSATSASTQATNAASSASTASTQATAAGTSATNAATSATAASGSASTASTQATNAATSASSASGSASTATTQASNASTSASAASTSATNAATSAATATTQAGIATTQATNAASSATSASTSATNAANYAAALIATSTTSTAIATGAKTFTTQASKQFNAGQFVIISSNANPANYMFAQVTSYSTTSLVVNVLAIGGSGTLTDWNISVSGAQGAKGDAGSAGGALTISNKTGAYTVVSGDLGSIINCTSGTFTVSLTAAASLGSGFTCTIWNTSNTSTDAITIDPSGAETIDGVATLILRRGEGLAIVCDGTNWQVDDKKPMRCYAENKDKTDNGGYYLRPIASGHDSVAVGAVNIVASGATSFAAGAYGATASGANSLALGSAGNSIAGSTCSTSIGSNSGYQGSVTATGAGAMALGGSYASGTDSFAAAIANNTSTYGATGANSVVGGYLCKSTGQYSVSLGRENVISSSFSTAIGFSNNVSNSDGGAAIGSYNTVTYGYCFGNSNTTTATYAVALGYGAKAAQYGKYAFSSGYKSVAGDTQAGKIVITAVTTTTTAVVLTSDQGAASTANQLIVSSGQAMAIQGTLIAKVSGTGAMAGWNITGIVSNNAGTMAVSGLALTAIGSDSIALGAQPTIAVDNTNKGVTITSGYKSATIIRWCATLNTSEVVS